jgi:hypothetical protein
MLKSMQEKKEKKRIKRHSLHLKNPKRRREDHMQKGVHHPSTIYTHMHILIRLYDLLLPSIWFSTWQYMRNRYATCFPYLQLHISAY